MTENQLLYAAYLEKKNKPDLLDRAFPQQCGFIEDSTKLKALFCTRRAAKSYTAGLYLIKEATENPGVSCLYIGLTRLSAKNILWKDVLKDIDRKHNLNIQFNETLLTATLPNGSIIYLTGVDADETEKEKLLGQKYKLVCLDEAASYTVNLRELVYGILKPAMADLRGTICLMGTSGNLTKGLFYDITNELEPGWRLFQWSAHDNPYVAKQWQEELDDIRINRPLFMQTPLFKQWYLNQWVVDEERLVYKFNRQKNVCANLPHYSRGAWAFVLGVDLGYEDASAFVLTAFHEHDKNLYVLETFKKAKMDITDVALKIKDYQGRHDIFKVVIDGANKQAVEEIQKRHGIALHAADKTGKTDFIEIMNAELIQARIKLCDLHNEALIDEWMGLIWETEGEKIKLPRKEHPNCENHLADAALYAWRYCYQFLSQAEAPRVDITKREQWIAHTRKLMDESLEKQIEKQKADESNQDFWNTAGNDEEETLSYFLNKRKQ